MPRGVLPPAAILIAVTPVSSILIPKLLINIEVVALHIYTAACIITFHKTVCHTGPGEILSALGPGVSLGGATRVGVTGVGGAAGAAGWEEAAVGVAASGSGDGGDWTTADGDFTGVAAGGELTGGLRSLTLFPLYC
nr:hypothetical protein Iba_chr04fCG2950 [Ipomoea batatas]